MEMSLQYQMISVYYPILNICFHKQMCENSPFLLVQFPGFCLGAVISLWGDLGTENIRKHPFWLKLCRSVSTNKDENVNFCQMKIDVLSKTSSSLTVINTEHSPEQWSLTSSVTVTSSSGKSARKYETWACMTWFVENKMLMEKDLIVSACRFKALKINIRIIFIGRLYLQL